MPDNEPMEVETSIPSEMELIRETGFPKGHEVVGPDGLSPSVFRDDSKV